MGTLEIIGVFWKGQRDPRNMYSFSGEIAVSDDGTFVGFISDIYGRASVKGRFVKGLLEFNKQYSDQNENVRYTLRAGILTGGDPVVGGWKGIYEIFPCNCKKLKECTHLTGRDRYGEAALSVFAL